MFNIYFLFSGDPVEAWMKTNEEIKKENKPIYTTGNLNKTIKT